MRTKTTLAIAAVLALVLLATCRRGRCGREGFVSQRAKEVYDAAKPLFDRTQGQATYSEYRMRVPGADAVQYTDLRTQWGRGGLTPEAAQAAL